MIQGAECQCGKKVASKRRICPDCYKPMKDAQFGDAGTVITHTTLYAPSEGFEGPIRLCMVELKEGPRVLCRYEGDENLDTGVSVEVKKEDDLYICKRIS